MNNSYRRAVLRFLNSAALVLVGFYFVIALCVLYFKLTGRLTEGQPMFGDMQTPTDRDLLIFIAISAVLLGACVIIRKNLQRR